MGNILNAVTSPFGVKLAKGGPYSDGGALDRQQGQVAPMAAVGNQMLQQGASLPGLQQMGMLQYMPQIFSQLSALTGVQNPLTGQQNGVNRGASGPLMDGANFGVSQNATDNSPFALNPVQQAQLNQQNSQTSKDYAGQMARFKAHLAARGLSNSSQLNSAQAYLKSQMLKQQNQNRGAAQYGAYQNRMDTVGQMGSMLNNLYGQQTQRQQQLLSNAQSLINPQIQNTGQQAQLAAQNSANTGGAFGSLLGAYLGGAFNRPAQQRNPYLSAGQPQQGPPTPLSAMQNSVWNYR